MAGSTAASRDSDEGLLHGLTWTVGIVAIPPRNRGHQALSARP